jgi:carbohydrate kinase (thermoresistant glucokinase family)
MPQASPLRVVVMGVCGCGKTTVGQALAARLGLRYVEGDQLHPPENVARMAAGTPLTDADRQGWLQAVGAELARDLAPYRGVLATCSALKRAYRDVLRAAAPGLRLVHLHGAPELLAARMHARQGHYMPASLLASQLQALQPPGDDEAPIRLDVSAPVAVLVAAAERQLRPPA